MKKTFTFLALAGIMFISCNNDDPTPVLSECDLISQIIEESEFNEVTTENYFITDVVLNGDCLEITLSSSGCDGNTWELNLYSIHSSYNVFPIHQAVKLELVNMEECLAIVQKTVSFDLTPFRFSGQNQVILNIEGWEEPVNYQY